MRTDVCIGEVSLGLRVLKDLQKRITNIQKKNSTRLIFVVLYEIFRMS